MALYKHPKFISQTDDQTFDQTLAPGANAPYSGIYRCLGCGKEVTSEQGNPLPPQSHHQHSPSQGPIRWLLIVYADHKPK